MSVTEGDWKVTEGLVVSEKMWKSVGCNVRNDAEESDAAHDAEESDATHDAEESDITHDS
ncbi:hypothetical protein E2C01_007215 [Portunus trituberculatus]|uniref:Uncharacterized protein n=1 Tax=Portunus trituberculatus TaxID=210409 RepID=A0A5B7CYU7_PORTR|nr:hypothetical protein [Portunus trituberculatus]